MGEHEAINRCNDHRRFPYDKNQTRLAERQRYRIGRNEMIATRRRCFGLAVLAVNVWVTLLSEAPAQDTGKKKPATGGTVYKFVNKTNKFTNEQCFWSMNGGKDWYSFAAKPTVPISGNGRVYFYVDRKPRNFDDFTAYWDFIEYNFSKGTWYGNTTQVDA